VRREPSRSTCRRATRSRSTRSTESAGPGYVAHWEPHERHEVRAKADSRFLLLLAPWPNPQDRTTSD
jgi:hypothetical protein